MQVSVAPRVLNVDKTAAGLAELERLMPGADIQRLVYADPDMLMSVQKARQFAEMRTACFSASVRVRPRPSADPQRMRSFLRACIPGRWVDVPRPAVVVCGCVCSAV